MKMHTLIFPPQMFPSLGMLKTQKGGGILMRSKTRLFTMLMTISLLLSSVAAAAPLEETLPIEITSPSVILAETATGTVIFEKNADERREVASVTKLMTALLVLEALEDHDVALTDQETVSQRAAAMKGSQALLDAGAVYTLEDLLRSMIIASANDSAVALAEYLSGTEENFVQHMNERAAVLGMTNTCYVNCTGYPQEGQYTTARDVMKLSCEVSRHPAYHTYASKWLDTLVHPSGRVTDLTNTNRLVRFYDGCDGFKTGSTDAAKFCVSATAQKNGMRLVAVVLGCENSQRRFHEARSMLDYGFATYQRVEIARKGDMLGESLAVQRGSADSVELMLGSGLSMLLRTGQTSDLRIEVSLPESIDAPVTAGQIVGIARVLMKDQVIAKLNVVAAGDVPLPGFIEGFYRILDMWR